MKVKLIYGIAAAVAVMSTTAVAQEQGEMTVYSDGAGQYQITVPAGWENRSTPELAWFMNADATAEIFSLAVPAADVQAGLTQSVEAIVPGFAAQPVASSEVPLPNGDVWTQNVYMLDDGLIVAALGRQAGQQTFTLIIRAPQNVLASETAVLNEVLFSHTLAGQTSVVELLPEYVNPGAYTEQDVTVTSGEYALPGTLTLPVGEGPFPAVVIVHGSGPNDRNGTLAANRPYRDLALGLASQGIAVLRYDKRTFVYREPVAGFTIDDEVTNDAVAAVELLRGLETIDSERVFVIGHSQGAMTAPRIAEQDGNLAGIVLMAGTPFAFDQVLSTQVDYLRSLDPNADVAGLDGLVQVLNAIRDGADPVTAFGGDENQAAYWASMIDYVPGNTAQTLDLPMLILQGERDYQVTMDDFAAWQDVLADNDLATFISYPALNHIFMALGDTSRIAIPSDYSQPGFVDGAVISDIAAWVLR